MKKKLEAELISIAHRILKLKNKSELDQLLLETQKLYDKLLVLKFVEDHFSDVKPTIGQSEIEDKIEAIFEAEPEAVIQEESEEVEETAADEPEEIAALAEEKEDEVEEEIVAEGESETQGSEEEIVASEEKTEEEEEIYEAPIVVEESTFKPAFELSFDSKSEEAKEEIKRESSQTSFDDLLGANYADPVFVKPEDLASEKEVNEPSTVIPIGRSYNDNAQVISINKDNDVRSLNDRLSKGIIIGLNDRVAFMNHLFANSSEDYNRVLSQLMTFDTYEEAQDFIDTIVKPDYNNWEGKDEYAERFMEIVEKKFS